MTGNARTVLLTGATGYIGSVIAERLISSGYTVHGLVRSARSAQRAASRGVVPVRGDLSETDVLQKAVEGASAVIHTAAYGGPVPGANVKASVADAAATLRFLTKTTAAHGVQLISTSGTGVYGDTGEATVDERVDVIAQGPFAELAEAEARLQAAPYASIVRAALVYGRASSPPILGSLAGVRERGRSGYVREERVITVVHVDDLADLYLLVLNQDNPPSLVIGADETLPSKEVMAAGVAAGVGGDLEQVTDEVAASAFGFPGRYLTMNMRVSGALARDTLGWRPQRPSILEEFRRGSYQHRYERQVETSAAPN